MTNVKEKHIIILKFCKGFLNSLTFSSMVGASAPENLYLGPPLTIGMSAKQEQGWE